MSSYPCPVPLCQHHIQTPFSMEALLISHMNSSEHVFIQDWQRGPPAPTPDDIGASFHDSYTLFL